MTEGKVEGTDELTTMSTASNVAIASSNNATCSSHFVTSDLIETASLQGGVTTSRRQPVHIDHSISLDLARERNNANIPAFFPDDVGNSLATGSIHVSYHNFRPRSKY